MSGNYFSQLARATGIVVEETALSKGDAMKPKIPDVQRVEERSLSSEPESMQKYSDEVRERIAKKAYELYEQRGREAERDVEDWLKAEELVRKEMNARRPPP
jgi:hypothetical protein